MLPQTFLHPEICFSCTRCLFSGEGLLAPSRSSSSPASFSWCGEGKTQQRTFSLPARSCVFIFFIEACTGTEVTTRLSVHIMRIFNKRVHTLACQIKGRTALDYTVQRYTTNILNKEQVQGGWGGCLHGRSYWLDVANAADLSVSQPSPRGDRLTPVSPSLPMDSLTSTMKGVGVWMEFFKNTAADECR